MTPAPGSYAIERAVGTVGSEGLYQPLTFVSGASTSFIDTTVQGGMTYTYRVIAATDAAGKCQALVRSGGVSATATGNCNLKPTFAGATNATSLDGPICGVTVNWAPGTSGCPLTPTLKYNVYRGTVPDFVPSAGNRIASCLTGTLLCRYRRAAERQYLLLCCAGGGQQHRQQRSLRRQRRG